MKENDLKKLINQHLDDKLETLKTSDIDQQLKQARITALDKAESSFSFLSILKPLPTSVFATLSLAVVALVLINQPTVEQPAIDDIADIELLITEDNLEFYEDLEFYQWLLLEEQRSS